MNVRLRTRLRESSKNGGRKWGTAGYGDEDYVKDKSTTVVGRYVVPKSSA